MFNLPKALKSAETERLKQEVKPFVLGLRVRFIRNGWVRQRSGQKPNGYYSYLQGV